jgi:hypothetical protein
MLSSHSHSSSQNLHYMTSSVPSNIYHGVNRARRYYFSGPSQCDIAHWSVPATYTSCIYCSAVSYLVGFGSFVMWSVGWLIILYSGCSWSKYQQPLEKEQYIDFLLDEGRKSAFGGDSSHDKRHSESNMTCNGTYVGPGVIVNCACHVYVHVPPLRLLLLHTQPEQIMVS